MTHTYIYVACARLASFIFSNLVSVRQSQPRSYCKHKNFEFLAGFMDTLPFHSFRPVFLCCAILSQSSVVLIEWNYIEHLKWNA